MEPEDWAEILAEERNHVLQVSVNGTFDLLGKEGDETLIAAAPALAEQLRQMGYKEPRSISVEIGSGCWAEDLPSLAFPTPRPTNLGVFTHSC